MKLLLLTSMLLAGIAFLPTVTFAQETSSCRPLFGGGPSCVQSGNITLDKKLKSPQDNTFIDHADITDPKFRAGQTIVFQLNVRNTSNRAIDKVLVTDIMPQYVTFTKGPGSYDKATNILTYTIEKLDAGQTQTVTVEGKIAPANALPAATGAICVVNQATATQARNTGSDNAQFCIEIASTNASPTPPTTKGTITRPGTPPVLPTPNITTSPKTGPEMLALIGLIPAGLTGFYLRRKTS